MQQKIEQQQQAKQVQSASAMQVMVAKLMELPVADLYDRVSNEVMDNPALEAADYEEGKGEEAEDMYGNEGDDTPSDPISDELADYSNEDDTPEYLRQKAADRADFRERQIAGSETAYDDLLRQMLELNLSQRQIEIMEYLIGSLDERGFLTKDAQTLADELAFTQYIDTDEEEINALIAQLQTLEPMGIGARNQQECFRLQLADACQQAAKQAELRPTLSRKKQALEVIDRFYDDFMHRRWAIIAKRMGIGEAEFREVLAEIKRLNPKPGSGLSDISAAAQTIIPDFYVDAEDDGTLEIYQNRGNLPELNVSRSYRDIIKIYNQTAVHKRSREQKDTYTYIRQRVESAQAFIESLRRRRQTLQKVMESIVHLQHDFFVTEDDDTQLRPMTLADIAQRTALDVSTVSRAVASKYVQTRYGTYPLRHFFSTRFTSNTGEELAARQVKQALADIVSNEDKQHPLSDEAITALLKERGLPVARRTVAKYRDMLGIDKACRRKE